MSNTIGLCRFLSNDHIYWCIFDEDNDIMEYYLQSPEDFEKRGFCRNLREGFSKPVTDAEPVELYADSTGGFCWNATASETAKVIFLHRAPFDDASIEVREGMPEWAKNFLKIGE